MAGTILRLNQAAFLTVPQTENMTYYRLPNWARDPELLAERIVASLLGENGKPSLVVTVFDDESPKGRFAGSDVVLADGTVAKRKGRCGIRLFGVITGPSDGEAGGAAVAEPTAEDVAE